MQLKRAALFILSGLITILMFTQVVLAQETASDDDCPAGQGFWANHPEDWPVTSLTLGTQTYTQAQLLTIIPGGGGDASTILAVQLIAAKLNVASGVTSSVADALIVQGDALLAGYQGMLPYNAAPSSAQGQAMIAIAESLDSFNSGAFEVGCEAESTPEATPETSATPAPESTPEATPETTPVVGNPPVIIVIEGPVAAINVNIITIYNFNIQVDAANPILTIIAVGDFLRVEGEWDDDSNILIAIVVSNITGTNDTGASIHIEGPIQAINGNIVIISGVQIQFDPDDPILAILVVGQFLSIDGDFQVVNNVYVLIVVTIINVFINPDSGDVYSDDGSCDNPPPPWAPANGWRRRCEGEDRRGNRGDDDDDDD